ncbi:MAG: PP2C family protein-serine/threonine phosphatase [Hyphomicrobiales bacterium]
MNHNECQHYIDPVSNRLRKLTEANRSLAEIETLDDLLLRLMDLAKEVTAAEASLLFLYNSENRLLEIVSIKDDRFGDRADELFKSKGLVKLMIGEGIAGWVAQNRKAVMVEDAQSDPRFSKQADKQRGSTTRTLICVPLVYRDELLGVLSVLNSRGKPFFDDEDLAILESFADLSAVAIIRSKLLEHRIEQERLRTELDAAAKIQKLFWPKLPELGEGSHLWAFSEPAASVGGDLYDVIPMPDASWLLYVADVSGKGLPAALMMAALSAKIRSIAPLQNEVHKLLANVNKEMHELISDEGFFATMVMSRYWPKTGKMNIARAGHQYPLYVNNRGFQELSEPDGIPIGIEFRTEYEKAELVLSPGEAILLVTDGVTEAENEKSKLFGNEGLTDYFKMAKGPPWGEALLKKIGSWRGNAAMNDDLTMVEIWRDPPK